MRSRTITPGSRPLRRLKRDEILARLEAAFNERDGVAGAHCIHELWMRNEPPHNVERLPLAYEVAARFERQGRRCASTSTRPVSVPRAAC